MAPDQQRQRSADLPSPARTPRRSTRCARPTGATTRRSTRSSTIRCTGATGGAGYKGHTVVYIAMHAWHGNRGLYLAQRIRQLYDYGCYVRILYSFMGHGTYTC